MNFKTTAAVAAAVIALSAPMATAEGHDQNGWMPDINMQSVDMSFDVQSLMGKARAGGTNFTAGQILGGDGTIDAIGESATSTYGVVDFGYADFGGGNVHETRRIDLGAYDSQANQVWLQTHGDQYNGVVGFYNETETTSDVGAKRIIGRTDYGHNDGWSDDGYHN